MEGVFKDIEARIEVTEKQREQVIRVLKGVRDHLRRAMPFVHKLCRLHPDAQVEETKQVIWELSMTLNTLEGFWTQLTSVLDTEDLRQRHYHLWRDILQDVSHIAALVHWVEAQTLVTVEEVKAMVHMGSLLDIDVEDYLIGLCGLPKDLSRLSSNCVALGDFISPLKILKFVDELYGAFQILNLRNDVLRKRFDSIKYEVQKAEQIVYDLKIRNLIPHLDAL